MATGHEVLFTWPHLEPNEVILSGTFNQWSRTQRLTKGPDGFSGTATVPWGEKTAYKFIVDGEWRVHEDRPTEPDGDGNINNVYTAPPNPTANSVVPQVLTVEVPTSDEDFSTAAAAAAAKGQKGLGTFPPNDIADTVAARAGTSSAFEYVASGLGAAIQGVVGVDPINADQIAIPTPLPTGATVAEFEVPKDTAYLTGGPAASAPAPAEPEVKQGPPVENAQEKAPYIPITIVPVNTSENRPVPNVPAPENVGTEIPLSPATTHAAPENKPSTHGIVSADKPAPVVGDIGAGPTDAVTGEPVTEKGEPVPEGAEPKPKGGDVPAPASAETPVRNEGGAGEEVSASKAAPAPPAEESGELPKPKPPIEGPPKPTIEALAQSALEAATQPGVETPPKSSTETQSKPPPMNTPQATTPNSDLNPASVLADIKTPSAAAGLRAAEVTPPFDTPVVSSPETPKTVPAAAAEPSAGKEKEKEEGVEGTEETGLPPTMAPHVEAAAETRTEGPAPEQEQKETPTPTTETEKPHANGKTGAAPAPVEKRPETPTTPKMAFPSGSPTASSSRTSTAASRKKKTSIFGKIKHLFDHDKEKEKEKEKAKAKK